MNKQLDIAIMILILFSISAIALTVIFPFHALSLVGSIVVLYLTIKVIAFLCGWASDLIRGNTMLSYDLAIIIGFVSIIFISVQNG